MKTCTSLMMIAGIATLLLSMMLLPQATSSHEADKITRLPGQPPVKFQQFGGYITTDEIQKRNLFYYFVEAEDNPSSKPLVLWLNGGPGCSSVGGGAFTENGPFRPTKHALIKNEYSWNKEANMLYLESPAGVGFSYSANKSYYDGINDEMTAKDNLVFLQNWLVKYQEYEDRDFFIAGESYAGHYVPQLATLILKSSLKLKLKGIAIGDPLLDFSSDLNPRGEYLWSHGLISDETYELLQTTCNYSQIYRQRVRKTPMTPPCAFVRSQMSTEMSELVDAYDVIHDNCPGSPSQQAHPMNEDKVDVCVKNKTNKYLNRQDVQNALNARLVGFTRWFFCSNDQVFKYHLDDLDKPSYPLLGKLTKAGIRVLVYSGDQDSIIPLFGTRKRISILAKGLNLKSTVPYQYWLAGDEVGGWIQVYGGILSYAIVRGAAHTVPSTQPLRSLVLFHSFITGKPLPHI